MQHVNGEGDESNGPGIKLLVLPFFADHPLHVGLFKDVQNAPFLRQQLLAGNTDFEYAFIDATSILSTKHILAACFRAVNDLVNNRLRSRNVHSEIVYALSANNNITDAFRHFGISDATTSLIAVKVSSPSHPTAAADVADHLKANVTGTLLPFEDDSISPLTDVSKIRKLYRVTSSTSGGKASRKKEAKADGVSGPDVPVDGESANPMDDRGELEAVILGVMAMKGS